MKIRMNTRAKFSVALVALGLIVALLPSPASRLLRAKPERLVAMLNDEESRITVDQVARFVVNEDDKVQIVDLRSADDFGKSSIPGSVNIPMDDFLERNPSTLLAPKNIKTILCSTGDKDAENAFLYARAMRFNNTVIMKGGLDEWTRTVLNTSFSGDTITARENALFETRTRARKMFTEFNALPDSLKQKYFAARILERKKLGGGCE
jgi:rhodanese-related sulfurtransferase